MTLSLRWSLEFPAVRGVCDDDSKLDSAERGVLWKGDHVAPPPTPPPTPLEGVWNCWIEGVQLWLNQFELIWNQFFQVQVSQFHVSFMSVSCQFGVIFRSISGGFLRGFRLNQLWISFNWFEINERIIQSDEMQWKSIFFQVAAIWLRIAQSTQIIPPIFPTDFVQFIPIISADYQTLFRIVQDFSGFLAILLVGILEDFSRFHREWIAFCSCKISSGFLRILKDSLRFQSSFQGFFRILYRKLIWLNYLIIWLD